MTNFTEEGESEIALLSSIEDLPGNLLVYIQGRVPTFKLKYSKTVGGKYYANTCPKCGIISGDFFLHSEPGAPFFPTSEEEAGELYQAVIPIEGPFEIEGGYRCGAGELIATNAKRIA